jgi:hypothetical protein
LLILYLVHLLLSKSGNKEMARSMNKYLGYLG